MEEESCQFLHVGQIAVSRHGKIKTVLGSCVAVVIWDDVLMMAGMNHYILPRPPSGQERDARYGSVAVPKLLEEMIRKGAEIQHLRARIIGGAAVVSALGDGFDVGSQNVSFARETLAEIGIELAREDTGGKRGRLVSIDFETFSVRIKYLGETA